MMKKEKMKKSGLIQNILNKTGRITITNNVDNNKPKVEDEVINPLVLFPHHGVNNIDNGDDLVREAFFCTVATA